MKGREDDDEAVNYVHCADVMTPVKREEGD